LPVPRNGRPFWIRAQQPQTAARAELP
jgi:hypothetical protein